LVVESPWFTGQWRGTWEGAITNTIRGAFGSGPGTSPHRPPGRSVLRVTKAVPLKIELGTPPLGNERDSWVRSWPWQRGALCTMPASTHINGCGLVPICRQTGSWYGSTTPILYLPLSPLPDGGGEGEATWTDGGRCDRLFCGATPPGSGEASGHAGLEVIPRRSGSNEPHL
jgi:hypothetical protein